MTTEGYALITGAARGLGFAFAREAAGRGFDLLIVDLPGMGLGLVARNIARESGKDVRFLELDLTGESSHARLLETMRSLDKPLKLLVNNVGVGDNGLFDLIPLSAHRRAVELNIQSTMSLTYGAIPLLEKSGGGIVTVASLAGFYPMPLFAVYAATKAFLLHWSLALRHELAPLGIASTTLAPGGIYTSEEIRKKTVSQGLAGRLSGMEPEEVAKEALDGLARGRAVVVPGFFNRLLMRLGSSMPKNFMARSILGRWKSALSKVEGSSDGRYYSRGEKNNAA